MVGSHVEGDGAEEVGFSERRCGDKKTTYGGRENLIQRVEDVLIPEIGKAEPAIELASMKLEYWDSFLFEGPPEKADVATLLEGFETALPADVLAGQSLWHSHIGWFEGEKSLPILINRNLDMLDKTDAEGEAIRVLSVYTLVEQRSTDVPLGVAAVPAILEGMHKRSLRLFGETLNEEYRKMIGIDLRAYQ